MLRVVPGHLLQPSSSHRKGRFVRPALEYETVFVSVLTAVIVLSSARDAAPASVIAPLTAAQVHAVMSAPTRHVRAVGPRLTKVIAEGMRRSGTFAHLVLALNRSDVIVYIETGRSLPTTVAGRLVLAADTEGQRYLRIQVTGHATSDDLIALVAHEMRHALEVAESPDVRDQRTLIALYERIGHPVSGLHQYDTIAAQDVGRKVKKELVS
jgi:hypothetical protein